MKTFTIPQNVNASIHSIANILFDRDIEFYKGCDYAVVKASFYSGKGYSTHKTIEATVRQSLLLTKISYSHKIIASNGKQYDVVIRNGQYTLTQKG